MIWMRSGWVCDDVLDDLMDPFVRILFGRRSDLVLTVFGRCSDGVRMAFGRRSDGVRTVSRRPLADVAGGIWMTYLMESGEIRIDFL